MKVASAVNTSLAYQLARISKFLAFRRGSLVDNTLRRQTLLASAKYCRYAPGYDLARLPAMNTHCIIVVVFTEKPEKSGFSFLEEVKGTGIL